MERLRTANGIPVMPVLISIVVLLFEFSTAYEMSTQSADPWYRTEAVARRLCDRKHGKGGDPLLIKGCRAKLRFLFRMNRDALEVAARPTEVMTNPMLRVLPCTLSNCAGAKDRPDLFECIRTKCIYQTYTQVQDIPEQDEPDTLYAHDEIHDLDGDLRRAMNAEEEAAVDDDEFLDNLREFFLKSGTTCFDHCSQGSVSDQHVNERDCFRQCTEKLRTSPDFRKRVSDSESIVTVGKRWSARLCMEAHCKRFEVNGGQWFRCGQNHCGR